jgi:hypothetical protein
MLRKRSLDIISGNIRGQNFGRLLSGRGFFSDELNTETYSEPNRPFQELLPQKLGAQHSQHRYQCSHLCHVLTIDPSFCTIHTRLSLSQSEWVSCFQSPWATFPIPVFISLARTLQPWKERAGTHTSSWKTWMRPTFS